MHAFTNRDLKKVAVLTLCLLTACSPFSPKIYNWRGYESAMLAEVLDPHNFDRLETIQYLRESLEQGRTQEIPPGALVHLAFLMEQEGLTAEARALLKREAELFPESKIWVQELMVQR